MEFDINLILVPVTLALLLIWLADKFVLKQHRAVKAADKALQDAKKQESSAQQALQDAKKRHQLTDQTLVIDEQTPQEVVVAHQNHQQAQQKVALADADAKLAEENVLVRWSYEFLPVLAFIVIVRSFVIEPFNIPSSSMVPTLYTGDFIVVNKASYGIRLPLTHTQILKTGSPERGDVAVFRYPLNEKQYFIKRIIGLPGDTVSYQDGVLSVNGQQVQTTPIKYQMSDTLRDNLLPTHAQGQKIGDAERASYAKQEEEQAHYYQEKLGNHSYVVRYVGDLNASQYATFLKENSPQVVESMGKSWSITVPEGQFFAMGDNRDRSDDSRVWGFVPEQNLSGKATYIWMHKAAGFSMPSFGRAGAID